MKPGDIVLHRRTAGDSKVWNTPNVLPAIVVAVNHDHTKVQVVAFAPFGSMPATCNWLAADLNQANTCFARSAHAAEG